MNSFLNQFPYSDFHEMNLDWLIREVKRIAGEIHGFEAANKVNYAGSWNITTQYQAWSMVLNENSGYMYISLKPVPSGIDIFNTEYWMLIAPFQIDAAFSTTSYNAIANKRVTDKFNEVDTDIDNLEDADTAINTRIDNTNNAISAEANSRASGDTFLQGQIDDEVTARTAADTDLQDQLDNEILAREAADDLLSIRMDGFESLTEGSTTGDAELIDIRTSDQGNVYVNAGASVRAQANKNQKTSTFVTYTRSSLANNGWINNSGPNPQSSDSWKYSDAIDISAFGNTQLYIYFIATGFNTGTIVVNNIAFFDENDTLLYGIHHPSANSETIYSDTIELPKYAKYMRICSKNDTSKPFFVSLFKKPSMIPADACSVIDKYVAKDIMYVTNSNGYLDTAGSFHSLGSTVWHTSPIKYTAGFNRAYYKLNTNNQVAAIALYREDESCIRVISGSSGSYDYATGVIDISEATYIRYCFHNDYTDANVNNHVILFNENDASDQYLSANYHIVNKPYDFNNKHAVFFGDSITEGVVTPGTITPNGYPKVFSDMVGLNYINKGVSGATIYRVSGYPCIYDTVQNTDLTGIDYVFIMGGSNDWQLGVTQSQFRSGLADILDLLSDFEGEIIFIAPIDTAGRNPIVTPAADLDDFRQVMKEVALINVNSFVNGKLFDMPTAHSSQAYIDEMFGDAIHPSEAGYKLIARGLRSALI